MPRPASRTIHPDLLSTARRWSAVSMIDVCTISRRTGTSYDPVTNDDVATATTIYQGRCRIQDVQPFGGARVQQFGGRPVTTSGYFAVLPADAAQVRIEDTVTITASADPQLVGRSMRVTEVLVDTFHAHRRLLLEDMSTPTGS